jgi:hypothetical protein
MATAKRFLPLGAHNFLDVILNHAAVILLLLG